MAKALGVGGVFFKAREPAKLAAWYADCLGIVLNDGFVGACFFPGTVPAGGMTVWSIFDAGTDYFAPSDQAYMINLMVDDVDEALAQVAAGGGTLAGDPESSEFGRFGWFLDPEGNKVELWQPPPPVDAS